MTSKPSPLMSSELWFLTHRHDNGKPVQEHHLMNIALAAGLIADLLASGHTAVDGQLLKPRPQQPPPEDVVLRKVLQMIVAEIRRWPLVNWLNVLADGADAEIASRLSRAGQLHRKVGFGRRWIPVEGARAEATVRRLKFGIQQQFWYMPERDPLLASVACVTGLEPYLLSGGDDFRGAAFLSETIKQLPAPWGELVSAVTQTVRNAVVTQSI